MIKCYEKRVIVLLDQKSNKNHSDKKSTQSIRFM